MAPDRRRRVTKPEVPLAIAADLKRRALESGIFDVGPEPYRCPRCAAVHEPLPDEPSSVSCRCGLIIYFNVSGPAAP